jgi:hypothetical protein
MKSRAQIINFACLFLHNLMLKKLILLLTNRIFAMDIGFSHANRQ